MAGIKAIRTLELTERVSRTLPVEACEEELLALNSAFLAQAGLEDADVLAQGALAGGYDPGVILAAVRLGLELGRYEAAN